MIDPTTIKRDDRFKIIKKDELYDLDKYQARVSATLKNVKGWKKQSDGNLLTQEQLTNAAFELPVIEDGLGLPPLTDNSKELIAWLEPGAEIKTLQLMYHTNKAASSTNNKDKTFQCLLVSTVISSEIKYGFVWTTHAGIDYIERVQEQEPPVEEPKLKETGTEIVVKAGQTVVLDVKADAEGTGKDEDKNIETGSFEVELVDEEGKPYTDSEVVQLIGDDAIYTVPIDKKSGKGSREDIVPGEYEVALQLGTVHFEFDKDLPTSSGRDVLEKVGNKLITTKFIDFKKIRCIGYADKDGSKTYNDGLCLKRAIYVKDQLHKIQERFKKDYIHTGIGGKLLGDSEEERKKNRRVEIYGVKKEILPEKYGTIRFIGEVGVVFEVIAPMGACLDYEKPSISTWRGRSSTVAFMLSIGDLIKIDSINHRVNGYEVTKGNIIRKDNNWGADTNKYYFWIIYDSVPKVKSYRLLGESVFTTDAPIFAGPKEGNEVKCYVDGENAFYDIAEAMKVASSFIYITDWAISTNFLMNRGVSSELLLDILRDSLVRGVQIRIVLWDSADIVGGVDNHDTDAERVFEGLNSSTNSARIEVIRHSNGTYWSHHQKSVVVDGVVAYIGGLDLCFGRWDTNDHSLVDPGNLFPGDEFYNPTINNLDRTIHPRMPWHDIHLRIEGPGVYDVERNFRERWDRNGGANTALPTLSSMPAKNGLSEVQVARSIGNNSGFEQLERGIMHVYMNAIRTAESFIHIEQQFFVSHFGTNHVQNRISFELGDRIIRAITEDKVFRVIIIIPLYPEGLLTAGSTRELLHWQFQTILRGGNDSLFPRIRAALRQKMGAGITDSQIELKLSEYINFFYLMKVQSRGNTYLTSQIYVHAKTMIVDDEVAIIGSANINDRSMLGDRDSEIGAVIADKAVVKELRLNLWKEHLGLDNVVAIDNPSSDGAYKDIFLKTANDNAGILLNVFSSLPRDAYRTFNEFDSHAGDLPINTETLVGVKGHIMLYPLHWLADEDLESFFIPDDAVTFNFSDKHPVPLAYTSREVIT